MDGLFHGKPYEQMDDLGGFTIIFETAISWIYPQPYLGSTPEFSPRAPFVTNAG